MYKRETHHHGYLSKSNNYAYITEIRLLDEAVVLILDDINQKNMNEQNITEINTDLLMRNRNKWLRIGNVAFKLKNLWYYFNIGSNKKR